MLAGRSEPGFIRPDPPGEGYVWMEVPYDWWRVLPLGQPARPCRMQGKRHVVCGRPSVAEMRRGRMNHRTGRRTADWWAYCAEHTTDYGFHYVGGKLMAWIREALT